MRKTEFLQELREALEGEVSTGVIQENISYYDSYITGETAKGRTEEEVIEEIGGPRLIARTIIDSSEAAGDTPDQETNNSQNGDGRQQGTMQYHSIDLSKWYWKVIISVVLIVVLLLVFTVLGGIFSLFFRFAGPLILIWLVFSLFRGGRR